MNFEFIFPRDSVPSATRQAATVQELTRIGPQSLTGRSRKGLVLKIKLRLCYITKSFLQNVLRGFIVGRLLDRMPIDLRQSYSTYKGLKPCASFYRYVRFLRPERKSGFAYTLVQHHTILVN